MSLKHFNCTLLAVFQLPFKIATTTERLWQLALTRSKSLLSICNLQHYILQQYCFTIFDYISDYNRIDQLFITYSTLSSIYS